jgi:O-methyltransferase
MKELLKTLIRKTGYELNRIPPAPSAEYEKVFPTAPYSPWNVDPEFESIYQAIKDCTLVDKYRCFELWQLVQQSAKLNAGALIEVGVWRGGTGGIIAKAAQKAGITDQVFLCDTFSGVVKAGDNDPDYRGGEHADATVRGVLALLTRVEAKANILPGIFPEETAKLTNGYSDFRFCHIDVDVYQSAQDILRWIWPKLLPGGIVVYDDYGFQNCRGITKHVNEQIPAKDRLVLHNLNGHAVVVKLS